MQSVIDCEIQQSFSRLKVRFEKEIGKKVKQRKEERVEEEQENKGCSSLFKKERVVRGNSHGECISSGRILTNEKFEKYVERICQKFRMNSKKNKIMSKKVNPAKKNDEKMKNKKTIKTKIVEERRQSLRLDNSNKMEISDSKKEKEGDDVIIELTQRESYMERRIEEEFKRKERNVKRKKADEEIIIQSEKPNKPVTAPPIQKDKMKKWKDS